MIRKIYLIISIICWLVGGSAVAEEISFEAQIDTDVIELGSSLQLNLTVNGSDSTPPIQLPQIDGIETRYLGPSTQVSIINGQMSRSNAMIFTVIPLRTGEFQIPPMTITINNKDYTSRALSFKVVDSGTLTPRSSTGPNNSVSGLQDKIFIVLGTSKKEAYLNEPVPLVIKLFINELQVRNLSYPTFAHDGFNVDQFGEPRRYNQTMGGTGYQVIEFKTFIYPTRTGELSIGPANLNANILIKSSRRSSIRGGVFDDDFFNSFFGNYDVQGVALESADLNIHVLPLPEEGKPANFSGAVGKYDFDMSVSPSEVKVGDPLTVRMKAGGQGNLRSIELPAYTDSKDFRAYDPKITEQNSEKMLEQVVIPNHENIFELPAVQFNFFDPDEKKYHTITKGPFSLKVDPLAKGEEGKVVGLNASSVSAPMVVAPEELGRDIRYIKENIGRLQKQGETLLRNFAFRGLLVIFILGWLGLWANYQIQQRLKTDLRFARRLQAPGRARAGLAQAKSFLDKMDTRAFYDRLFKTLQDYLGNKFHLPSGGVTVEAIRKMLPDDTKSQEAVERVRQIFNECEFVRYASGDTDVEKMRSALAATEETIDLFERSYR